MTDEEVEKLHTEVKRRIAQEKAERELRMMGFRSLDSMPHYVPDEQNPAVLFRGRWLERGGSAWIVSTSGTGKSIFAMQMMLSMTVGKPFAGITPNGPLRCWYIQSEDSDTRLGIDRDDVAAELAEQNPDVPAQTWKDAMRRILIMPAGGVGAAFISNLAMKLEAARRLGTMPDVIVINPFLAVVGGPITDGAFVTPFLRGGKVAHEETDGLQRVLETYGVGALIFHHTPKPPTDKEVQSWLKSAFPEYQGAGSSDITNWGRSFVTIMRVPGKPNVVCLTAGKNGADLGWDNSDGAYRRYMAWSRSVGVTGRNRHAWRELTDEEMADVAGDANDHLAEDALVIVKELKASPQRRADLAKNNAGLPRNRFRAAWNLVTSRFSNYGLAAYKVELGGNPHVVYGEPEAAKAKADEIAYNFKNAHCLAELPEVRSAVVPPSAAEVPRHVVPAGFTLKGNTRADGTTSTMGQPYGTEPEILTEDLQI